MVNCYSMILSYSTYIQLSDDEIMGKCTFEYAVQFTDEMYLAIQSRRLRVLPLGYKDGVEMVKVFYFGKEIVKDDTDETSELLDIIHKTIYQFIDVCGDDEEVPMSDKDKLLLEVNKAICNNLKKFINNERG